MRRILVTGASGFVGRALTQALAQSGTSVRAAARDPARIPAVSSIEPVALPDLASTIDWGPLLTGVDQIVHLAGIAHAGPGISDVAYMQVNRAATESLARAAAKAGVGRLVFVSSIRAQSGPSADHVLRESDPPRPTDAYGRSKLAAEEAVSASGVAFTILRPAVIYGPGVKGNLASLMRLAASAAPLPFGVFHNLRSLLALDNLISAIHFTLGTPSAEGETYIVADAAPLSFADIVITLRMALGRRPRLVPVPPALIAWLLKALGRGHDWDRLGGTLVADAGKLRAAGWVAQLDTRSGLAAMIQAASPRKSGTASRRTR